MTADLAIITAIYDGFDTVKPVCPQIGLNVEWVLVTDQVPDADTAVGWTIVHEPQPGVPARWAAKRAKCEPWRYTDAPASIWVDGSFRVLSTGFAADVLAHTEPVAQFPHPVRDCLYAEAREVARVGLDPDEVVLTQAARYLKAGHPERWGLWASGVIGRRHTDQVRRMGALWAEEIAAGSGRDQVSEPFVLRETGLRPVELPGTHHANPWLAYEGSNRHR